MDAFTQSYQLLAARYQLKWPNDLIDQFLGLMESKLSAEEFRQSCRVCLQKENFMPSFDWFIEVIKGTSEQQAQQKLLSQGRSDNSEIVMDKAWHTERLKAKIYIGRSLRNPHLIQQACNESIDLGINLESIGGTENDLHKIIDNANAEARHIPDAVESGQVKLHRIGAIAAKGMIGGLIED